MAPPAKKKKFTIRFELGILGLFGLLVVCAAIFFWMFLLGLWAGQSVFTPISAGVSPFARFASPFEGRGGEPPLPALAEPQRDGGQEVVSLPVASAGEEPAGEGAAEPTFFALQVSAFREAERAERDAEQWRARGYDAFLVPPQEADDPFSRVYVGKFDRLADANQLAARLEKEQGVKAYIALVSAARLQGP